MIKRYNVHCGPDEPLELLLDKDTVYKRYNIHKYTDQDGNVGWEYDEDELTITEYFREVVPEHQQITEEALGELSEYLANYQEQVDNAIGELSELIGEALGNV